MASFLLSCWLSPHSSQSDLYTLYIRVSPSVKTPQCFLTALGTKSKLSIMAYEKVTFKCVTIQTKMGH